MYLYTCLLRQTPI